MRTLACLNGMRRFAFEPCIPRRASVDRGWKRSFEDPIPLPRGRQLVTLEDAGKYITKLPKAGHVGRPGDVCAHRRHAGSAHFLWYE